MASGTHKIVICGAGIAGVATAYALAVVHGQTDVVIIEAADPLSLTSDKSTECYRNWWPGPDRAMTAFMNRSIDLLEGIARASGNRINLNRRGYLFASADASKVSELAALAERAEALGSGPVRVHDRPSSRYTPSPESGFEFALTGADIVTDADLIRRHFAYLAPDTRAVLHARRAGWLSAQQLGTLMLEAARARGVRLLRATLVGIELSAGRVRSVAVEAGGERATLEATTLVIAAGPMQKDLARLIGIELPVFAERHQKVSFADRLGAVPRHAPLLIWLDPQQLPWSDQERAALAEDESARWLLAPFPPGVHARPEGGGSSPTVLLLYNYQPGPTEVVFPLPVAAHDAEIALRGMSRMVPALKAYGGSLTRPVIDGGYYIKTHENRPLLGPLPVEGVFICGAFSGFGVMAACAGGELVAGHILERPLPDYAPAFLLSRYQDARYRALLDAWGDGGQL
jgi:glycine/D-amino acid oxidase-like deaminating enzyme